MCFLVCFCVCVCEVMGVGPREVTFKMDSKTEGVQVAVLQQRWEMSDGEPNRKLQGWTGPRALS